jgi:hypothetical protein
MRGVRVSTLMLALALAAAAAWAGPGPERPGPERKGPTSTTFTGTYSVTFNLTIASTLPSGSTITCKVQILPGVSGMESAAVPVEAAAGVAVVTGTAATCTVEIPFAWTLSNTRGGVSMSYEIDAFNATGTLPNVVRTSAQQGMAESYPASGGTTNLTFNVTF